MKQFNFHLINLNIKKDYAQKPFKFALSPLRLEQACASCPPNAAVGCVSPLAGNSLEGGYEGCHAFG